MEFFKPRAAHIRALKRLTTVDYLPMATGMVSVPDFGRLTARACERQVGTYERRKTMRRRGPRLRWRSQRADESYAQTDVWPPSTEQRKP